MAQISHLVRIKSDISTVFKQVASTEGIAKWFTEARSKDYKQGGKLTLIFPEGNVDFTIKVLTPNEQIVWHCISEENPWFNTDIKFTFKSDGNRTTVLFDHLNWPAITDLFRDCSMSWAYFLESLCAHVEEGKGTPESVAPPCESNMSKNV